MDGGAGGASAKNIKDAWRLLFNISVPKPSLALTASEEKSNDAEPGSLILKTTLKILPADPVNPGVGIPPLKEIVPALLEKFGSKTHNEKIDPNLLTEVTSKNAGGKFITASVLLIATPLVSTKISTVKIFPLVKLPEEGLKYKVAAFVLFAVKTPTAKSRAQNIFANFSPSLLIYFI